MSSSSPNHGRILRSHVKKPEDGKEKEKDAKLALAPEEKEKEREKEKDKEKKKRKNKSVNANSDDTQDSEVDLRIGKSGKKKRKINTRTAHSDGEQEFVELGTKSKSLKIKRDPDSLPLTSQSQNAISNDAKFMNIMEPIFTLRTTLANVLARLPKPTPPPSSASSNVFNIFNSSNAPSSAFVGSNDGALSISSSTNPSSSSSIGLPNSNISTFIGSNANSSNFINNNNNNSNTNNNNSNIINGSSMFSQLSPPVNSQALQTTPNALVQTQQGQQGTFWGSLISQYPYHSNIPLSGASYSIGRRTSRCTLALPDDHLSTTLCRIYYASGIATIESCSGSSSLQLNNQAIRKGYTLILRSGDELSFTGQKHYSFIFQLYTTTTTSATPNSSLAPTNIAPSSSSSSTTTTTTTTSTSASTPHASAILSPILSSSAPVLSNNANCSTSSSSLPATTPAILGASADTLIPTLSIASNNNNNNNNNKNNSNIYSFLDVEKSLGSPQQPEVLRSPLLIKRSKLDISSDVDSSMILEADEQNASQGDISIPFVLSSSAPSNTSDFIATQKPTPPIISDPAIPPPLSLSSNTSAPTLSSITSTTTTTTPPQPEQSAMKATFKAEMTDMTILPTQTLFTLDDFPYYIAKETKQMLTSAAFLFLLKPDYVKYTSDLPSVSRRILLEGPTGTDLYQEALVKALAKQYNANLLIIDQSYFDTREKSASTTVNAGGAALSASTPLLQVPPSSSSSSASASSVSSTLSASLPVITSTRPALSELTAEDEDCDMSPEEYTRRIAAFDVTKRRFKIDDRIKFTGPTSSYIMGRHLSSAASSSIHGPSASTSASSATDPINPRAAPRGPQVGSKGKVVITFDDNPRRVGVRFDKPIAGGVDLGGLCEESHGFFVETSEVKRESESADDRPDALAITVLFEMLASTTTPTILCFKDAEKVLLANYERYAHIKREFTRINKLPVPVLIIGTNIARVKSTASSSSEGSTRRGDKGHGSGLLFSKAASHHTALLDLSFFDHISRIEERAKETSKTAKFLCKMLSNKIVIVPPKDPATLAIWREKLDKDVEQIKSETNQANIRKALERSNLECTELNSQLLKKQVFTSDNVERIIGWAVSNHLMTEEPSLTTSQQPTTPITTDPSAPSSSSSPPSTTPVSSASISSSTTATTNAPIPKLEIGLKSIEHAIDMLTNNDPDSKSIKTLKDVETDSEFEKRILSEVIPPQEIAIRFEDIGALGKVKETLKELVMLPLQRPELFRKGNLTKPCKGILLFGPPGTGKTMLAKAVATESGANFINVSMSTIGSKWFGEGEKYARAVFTLAGKISPSVIFIDEVDSILGKRDRSGEHEAMRKIKNEFMSMWDGLRTREGERVLVLAATNRPFDLDDAVLRRLSRRLMVDLPDQENRTKILQVILAKEDLHPSIDYNTLASMTEGYSGSDLKNLSIAAAYQPIREFLRNEKKDSENATVAKETTGEVNLRAITLADFVKAKDEVSPSVHEDAFSIAELRKWNDMYGEGGSRVKSTLTYFV